MYLRVYRYTWYLCTLVHTGTTLYVVYTHTTVYTTVVVCTTHTLHANTPHCSTHVSIHRRCG